MIENLSLWQRLNFYQSQLYVLWILLYFSMSNFSEFLFGTFVNKIDFFKFISITHVFNLYLSRMFLISHCRLTMQTAGKQGQFKLGIIRFNLSKLTELNLMYSSSPLVLYSSTVV